MAVEGAAGPWGAVFAIGRYSLTHSRPTVFGSPVLEGLRAENLRLQAIGPEGRLRETAAGVTALFDPEGFNLDLPTAIALGLGSFIREGQRGGAIVPVSMVTPVPPKPTPTPSPAPARPA